jgi:hypothetical protein
MLISFLAYLPGENAPKAKRESAVAGEFVIGFVEEVFW